MNDYHRRLSLTLEGLVPIAWMERASDRAQNPREPTMAEMFITPQEREWIQERLCMADDLAVGAFGGKSKGSLAALAKALVVLALVPGGAPFLGRRYRTESWGSGVRLVIEDDQGIGAVPRSLTEVATEALKMAQEFLDGQAQG